MDAAQIAALHAASTRLATAQATALNAATDATTAEAAATTAAAANPIVQADVTAANAHATQARVAAIMANTEVEAATAAVNALMIKPMKPFKPHGQAPPFDMEERKDSFDMWETQWKIFIELSTIKDLVPGPQQPEIHGNSATILHVTKHTENRSQRRPWSHGNGRRHPNHRLPKRAMQRREEQTSLAPTIQVLHATTRALDRQLAMQIARPSEEMRVRDVLQPLRRGTDAGPVPVRPTRQRSAAQIIRHRPDANY
jgi:hypothetical protein